MTKVVKQKTKNDCALACLAMVSGKNYDKIFKKSLIKAIEKAGTATGDNLDAAYKAAGYIKDETYKVLYTAQDNANTVRSMIWKRKALLQVDSLNYEGGMHLIFWDGEKLIDPSNHQTYKFIKNIAKIYYVTVFSD
jgi:ABC-type bacteriocin/lantibiotic exporter with double-glycine peptidase domain